MDRAGLTLEERIGLVLAVALHAGVLALLVLKPGDRPMPPPPRMEVTLSDKVGLNDSAPSTHEQAAADIAPQLGAAPPPPAPPAPANLPPPPSTMPLPRPVPPKPVPPKPVPPKPVPPKPAPPKPVPEKAPLPKPLPAKVTPRPRPQESPEQARPMIIPHLLARPRPAAPDAAPPDRPSHSAKIAGGSRIGADFLKGVTSANTTGKANSPPAQIASAADQASLLNAIFRQLRPNWHAPQGLDAEKLETCLTWDLKPDGSLDGAPRMARPQGGVNDSNRPQASRHLEQAIRAVELAEPFQLPPEYYATWKRVGPICFNRKMSQ